MRRRQLEPQTGSPAAAPAEVDLVRRALAGDGDAFRTIMTTHNRGLYRVARSILRNDAEAEDAVQESYLSAFRGLGAFHGESSLRTWLTRIVINEAMSRRRKDSRRPLETSDPQREAEIINFPLAASADPERTMAQREILRLVEQAIDDLPEAYRTVFIQRALEGMSVEETADLLDLKPETVKTRLHRARLLLRERIDEQIGVVLLDAFPFAGRRCERMTRAVMRRLGFSD